MTTREKLIRDVLDLPEAEIEPVAEFIASRGTSGTVSEATQPSDNVDDWGNLDAQADAAAGDLMARLDEEEIAEFGETISQAGHLELSAPHAPTELITGPHGPSIAATGTPLTDEDVRRTLEAVREHR